MLVHAVMNHETDKYGGSMEFFTSEIQFFGQTNVVTRRSRNRVLYEFWID